MGTSVSPGPTASNRLAGCRPEITTVWADKTAIPAAMATTGSECTKPRTQRFFLLEAESQGQRSVGVPLVLAEKIVGVPADADGGGGKAPALGERP